MANPESLDLKLGEKFIQIWNGPEDSPGSEVIDWFTTEKLIFDRSRGLPGVHGFSRFREAATYELLYVGIAKTGDTYQRLVQKGHTARQRILSNEPQRLPGARVADEIYLFMYSLSPLFVRTIGDDGKLFGQSDLDLTNEPKRIVADAEKAFVSLLKPQYNVVQFKNYPKGDDGLYGAGLDRYGYVIAENVTFNTAHGAFRGGRDSRFGAASNGADGLFVDGDTTVLMPGDDNYGKA